MQINLTWDSSVANAPANFKTDIQNAANVLGSTILNPVSVTINVGYAEYNGSQLQSGISLGGVGNVEAYSYNQLSTALKNAETAAGQSGLAAVIPSVDPFGANPNANWIMGSAEAKALGLAYQLTTSGVDGSVGFGTTVSSEGGLSLFDAALHELTHALGRIPSQGNNTQPFPTPINLYTYSAAGQIQTDVTTPGYFSVDKGVTNLANFDTADRADFSNTSTGTANVGYDSFSEYNYGTASGLSQIDLTVLSSLGFDVVSQVINLGANQQYHVTQASDSLVGGSNNTVIFTGAESQYTLTPNGSGGLVVSDAVVGQDGTTVVTGVGRLQFSDYTHAYDFGTTQSSGQAAELINAGLGHGGLSDKVLFGDLVSFFDHGGTMTQAAHDFVASGLVSASDNTSFVSKVWQNVVGTPIDSADLSLFTGDLANGTIGCHFSIMVEQ
jgi:hypothetical protein